MTLLFAVSTLTIFPRIGNDFTSPAAEEPAVLAAPDAPLLDCLQPAIAANNPRHITPIANRKDTTLIPPSYFRMTVQLAAVWARAIETRPAFHHRQAYKRRMDSTSELPQQITEALERSRTVLTANQRAARTLRHAFDLRQRSRGIAYWEPPSILAWDAWLESQWTRLLMDGRATELLLNPTQEQTIWRAVIKADTETASLRPVDALAQTAADAWMRLHQFRGRQLLQTCPGNADTRAFARWAIEFERRCTRAQYLTEAQLPERLRAAVASGDLRMFSDGLFLVGFDSKTPAQIALLEAIRATDVPIDELNDRAPAPSLTLADAPDEYSELTACARWLRTRLTEQPSSSIAVIVPAIETTRAEIDRVFRQILAPELDNIAATAGTGPYEFSLGVSLAHTPLAAAALDILHWAIAALPLERVSALLLSSYFATESAQAELIARAEFDAFVLRDQHLLQPVMSIDNLNSVVSNSRYGAGLPSLQNHLRALRPVLNTVDSTTAKRTHADWTAVIHDILEAAGWAVPSHLDSIEFQTRRKWESALDELTTLDFDGMHVSIADALAALERIATETLFAPESRHAPVQIMGPLESAGSSFDAVWLLRANDLAWPSRPASNPLLPWLLQRELAMPGVDPARDAAHARRITERIAASAPTVLFSYARQSAEGNQRSSSTLAALPLEERNISGIAPAAPVPTPIELDELSDDTPIPPPPDCVLQGGAGILRSQAQCGFRAFAEKRLFSSALEPTSLGLDARDRGSLVHAVLEHFWTEVQTQAALKTMPDSERVAQLHRSIDIAFSRHYSHPAPGWPRAYIDAERQRLINLLMPWLDFEAKERPAFTVKSREEKLRDVKIGPLHLEMRVDRVDVAAGTEPGQPSEIILDYKTGHATPADWLGPRPDEPQLPLYAIVSDTTQLAALAFAKVRAGDAKGISGYEAIDGVLPKATRLKADNFATQLNEWRATLTSLAEAFHSGDAAVSPKLYPKTCEFCKQRLLCRLDPTRPDADEPNFEFDPDAEAEFFDTSALEVARG
jgi:probable DNA repair protein